MKIIKTTLSIFALFAVLTTSTFAQSDASADVGATATVFGTLTITVNDSLSFGGISTSASAASVVPADGSATTEAGAAATPASVSLAGTANASVSITYSGATLSDGDGTTVGVTVEAYDGTTTDTDGAFAATLDGSGEFDFYLGGEADFQGVAAGVYNTSNSGGSPIAVTVNYD